jgi:hypothetical protein
MIQNTNANAKYKGSAKCIMPNATAKYSPMQLRTKPSPERTKQPIASEKHCH